MIFNWSKTKQPMEDMEPQHILPSDIRIGIWGSSGAGKTTYLTMLYHVLTRSDRWIVKSGSDEADDFITRNSEAIENDEFPARTEPDEDEKLKIYSYKLTREDSKYKGSITLQFIDAPGEFYERLGDKNKKYLVDDPKNPKADVIDYLMSCDGIIFLLDPDPDEQNLGKKKYSTMLSKLFRDFDARNREKNNQEKDRLENYIAICVTKVDHDKIWEKANNQGADTYVEELISPRMKLDDLKNYIWLEKDKNQRNDRTKHNRCQFFYTSVLGRYEENGESRPIYIDKNQSSDEHEYGDYNNEPYTDYSDSMNNSASSDSDKSYDWGDINDESKHTNRQELKNVGVKIQPGSELKPFGVLEPIEWLIEGIQSHPPIGIRN
jgi:GTPase SAR1 family protein